jgi:hypothetical protein
MFDMLMGRTLMVARIGPGDGAVVVRPWGLRRRCDLAQGGKNRRHLAVEFQQGQGFDVTVLSVAVRLPDFDPTEVEAHYG